MEQTKTETRADIKKHMKIVLIILICSIVIVYLLTPRNILIQFNGQNISANIMATQKTDEGTKEESLIFYKSHYRKSVSLTRDSDLYNQSRSINGQLQTYSDSRNSYGRPSFKVKQKQVKLKRKHYTNSSLNANGGITNSNVFKVGILIPSTTRGIRNPELEKLSLINICIPSIYKFMEMDYHYFIYVGIDKGDYLEAVKLKLENMFDRLTVIVTSGGTFTKAVNTIARVAYKESIDYLVRINDDTEFETNNWTSQAIQMLQNFSPSNVGVVGPTCKEGNTRILTHDMVHRTPLEIFDYQYYPTCFDNWFTDGWITRVYQPKRYSKIQTWRVKHHLSVHYTRYKVDMRKRALLNETVINGKQRLLEYISKL